MRVLLLLVLMLIAWAAECLLPPEPPSVVAAVKTSLEAGGPGHGAYCTSAGGAPVFLGRDVQGALTYRQFEAWCEAQGGRTGWSA